MSGIIFERFVPLGPGAALNKCVLSTQQWDRVLGAICEVSRLGADLSTLFPYKAFWLDLSESSDDPAVSGAPCNLGPSSMALMPDGTVFPCRRLPLAVGKLPYDTIFDIRKKLEYYSPVNEPSAIQRARYKSDSVERCADCRALATAVGAGWHKSQRH
ncbi:MAG: hypothetical protein GF344_16680 [Chitinivibrionales bacterium]|nr:hypothetical protein [Chitinivibrionales bacterium]MBD3358324.1 hypothetical protein [Chitinivibrionales bacterium]